MTLHAVRPGEAPPSGRPRRRQTITQAAETGTYRDLLVAMRRRVAETVQREDCHPRDVATLTKRLADIAAEIDKLDRATESDGNTHKTPPDEVFRPDSI